jgi:tripartite-type tricarboxylate transporter receptor subunit TctC
MLFTGGETMKRSFWAVGLTLLAYALSVPTPATVAQPYPNRPIQLVIANVPGAIVDICGRALGEEMERVLGTKIVPINKPGAATTLGLDFVVRSKKDGYTLAYTGNSGLVYAPILNPQTVPYDPDKDLEPLALHLISPLAIAVQASSPWKTFPELIDYARKNPGKIRVDTIGVGSTPHFAIEMIQSLTGAQFSHVPFKGGESVITALLGGHVEMTCDTINKFVPHVESGKLRVLLLTNKMSEFPNVPTMADLGYKEDLPFVWFAVYGPAGLPEEVKKALVPGLEKAIKNPELKAKLEKLQSVVEYKSPADLKKMATQEYTKMLEIAVKTGLRK